MSTDAFVLVEAGNPLWRGASGGPTLPRMTTLTAQITPETPPAAALERIFQAGHPMVVQVGAELAAHLLTLNTKNRHLRREQTRRIARDILGGHWVFDGNPLVIDDGGNLVAGQHRCQALVEAAREEPAITMLCVIVVGADPRTVLTSNSGIATTPGDVLAMQGVANAQNVAAAIRMHHAYVAGMLPHARSVMSHGTKMTNQELLDHLAEHPGLVESTKAVRNIPRSVPMPLSALSVAHYVLMDVDADEATEFFRRLQDMELHGTSDPIGSLVQRVQREVMTNRAAIKSSTALYLLLRTWNAIRTGESIYRFQVFNGNAAARMPQPA